MDKPASFIATFTTFLTILLFTQCHARNEDHSSLVLDLTHSRASLPIPTASRGSTSKPLQKLDMLEPLTEVRDGYLISLNIGTPPQVIQVYMDTGSDLTWVPCGNLTFDCMDCDDYRSYKAMATFSPSQSSSASRDLCTSPFCIDYDLLRGSCPRPCPSFSYTYGAGGIAIGSLTRDNLRVHGILFFGCVGVTYREPIGIVGFGKGTLSFPHNLGCFKRVFLIASWHSRDLAISSKDYLQFTPMLRSPMYPNYYYICHTPILIQPEWCE
ncbi:hypothetical protein NE237_000691 [Protea cynaroides]|uniref:Peptidase A1 domain-containing protein n=1 Tax=Protea cynaroides TaxID=273540 RepID=A0A9Q0QXQ9_9MAGN|nr:hypothetical protein NE237_000691 [Protea cynaroides]